VRITSIWSPWNARSALSWLLAIILSATLAESAGAIWYDLGGGDPDIHATGSIGGTTTVVMNLGGFDTETVVINGDTYHHITVKNGGHQEEAGLPDLPDVRCSLIIANDKDVAVTFLSGEYVDILDYPVTPAKGPITRDIDPSTVPYTFSDLYQQESAFPAVLAEDHDPYILRDFRGVVIDLNAFQYFPEARTLRVYTQMTVEVTTLAAGSKNLLSGDRSASKIDSEFDAIYNNHFVNYSRERYTQVSEQGDLLIITPDIFVEQALTLADWKNQKGLATEVATLTETGGSFASIKAYIQSQYDAGDLAYVILLGDAEELPPMNGDSDPSYALLAGSDSYPDIFIGRLSGENSDQLMTQIERTITYERDLDSSDTWLGAGLGIASNLPGGHYGETDSEHMNIIREKLLNYSYSAVDSLYGTGVVPDDVADQLNAGRGSTNYIGHGHPTYWSTTHFSVDHVNELENCNRLPFIHSAACENGAFIGQTCFAESWLRATHLGQPTGGVAAYMSVINQYWIPPMDAQDETVDLLVSDQMRTIGGLWYNGSCKMIDLNSSRGPIEFRAWTIFGDPSLAIRTDTPSELVVTHPNTIMVDQLSCDIEVAGVSGALCALTADGVIFGLGYTDEFGDVSIPLTISPPEPMALTLTVTAYNKTTYIATVIALSDTGPYLATSEIEFLVGGEPTEFMEAGQTIQVRARLENVGLEEATAISSTMTSMTDEFTVTQAISTYPNILPSGDAWNDVMFSFEIDPDCADGFVGELNLTSSAAGGYLFDSNISIVVHSPDISIWQMVVADTIDGDGNYHLDPGESGTICLTLLNSGTGPLDDIEGVVTCDNPEIQIAPITALHTGLGENETGQMEPLFEVSIDPSCLETDLICTLTLTGSNLFNREIEFILPIGGFVETMENGAPNWEHYSELPSYSDQWHISQNRNHTTDGRRSWKCGADGEGSYDPLLDAALETPPVNIYGNGELRFWMWMDIQESDFRDEAYDGGLVEISIDGAPFEQITPVDDYTHTIRTSAVPGPFAEGTRVFSGSVDWQEVIFELGEISGEVVFRFRFGTDGDTAYEGWYIDDLEILGTLNTSDIADRFVEPTALSLSLGQPNPFTAVNTIRFQLPKAGEARLQVYDPTGRLVKTIVSGPLPAGEHQYSWDGLDKWSHPAAGGLYYYSLRSGHEAKVRSVVLVR